MSDIIMEPPRTPPQGKSQPIEAIAVPEPLLDDAAVRQAIFNAEANNMDPQSITLDDLAQGSVNTPPASKPVEVPPKFLKPDGAVDVDKIQASTEELKKVIQDRDPIPQKTVEDYLKENRELEKKFRSQTIPKQTPLAPIPVVDSPPQNFEEVVRRDYQADPLATTARLVDLIVAQRFAPMEEREKIEATRANLQGLVNKDPRVLREDVYAAINAKLANDPDLWKLKNPHKAAWLEVKEEMRLGEAPQGAPAQPSRPLSPVLGGGTPPSAPSSASPSQQVGLAALDTLDLRDRKQEALGDEAVRRALMGQRW